MDEHIKRDDALKAMKEQITVIWHGVPVCAVPGGFDLALKAIENIPAADVAEVRLGEEGENIMGRLTYTDGKGSWGLKALDWQAMAALPPQVYGALAKLKDMENLIDEINDPASGKDGSAELAMEHLMAMGSASSPAGLRCGESWLEWTERKGRGE